jgi:PKD repeat protein
MTLHRRGTPPDYPRRPFTPNARAWYALAAASLTPVLAACGSEVVAPFEIPPPSLAVVPSEYVWIGAGDIADCGKTSDEKVADLIGSMLDGDPSAEVFTAGDNVYDNGTAQEYRDCYGPNWGQFKDRTWAALGNHEYNTGTADPSFDYFTIGGVERIGPRDKGYYSLDRGDWHIVMLNSNTSYVPMKAGSAQEQWLRADLAATDKSCILAVFHHPRFYSCSSGTCTPSSGMATAWNVLYEFGADVIINGHRHHYERFAPQDPAGNPDPDGIREFVVGTGGVGVSSPPVPAANTEVIAPANSFGVIRLTLRPGAYDWEFVGIPGVSFTDSGTGSCGGSAPQPNQAPTAAFSFTTSGLSASFTDGSTDADGIVTSRLWDFGDGSTSTATDPTHLYASGGTRTVTLTVTDDGGAFGTTSKSVTVSTTPANQAPVADFGWTVDLLNVQFSDASHDPDGSVVSWLWSFGDGSTSTAQDPIHAYGSGGTYTVTLTVTDAYGATGTTTHDVTPNQPVSAAFQVSCKRGDQCQFRDRTVDDGPVSGWSWTLRKVGSSTVVASFNEQSPEFQFGTLGSAGVGSFELTLSVPDDKDASYTSTATQTVTCQKRGSGLHCGT